MTLERFVSLADPQVKLMFTSQGLLFLGWGCHLDRKVVESEQIPNKAGLKVAMNISNCNGKSKMPRIRQTNRN